ncbi:MAG: hypothetical protein ABI880_07150 [Acidobacteriota bacterium]
MFRRMPALVFYLMVALGLVMTVAAVILGWISQQAALRRRVAGGPRGLAEDALGAGVTVAVVPFACAVFLLWGRFG